MTRNNKSDKDPDWTPDMDNLPILPQVAEHHSVEETDEIQPIPGPGNSAHQPSDHARKNPLATDFDVIDGIDTCAPNPDQQEDTAPASPNEQDSSDKAFKSNSIGKHQSGDPKNGSKQDKASIRQGSKDVSAKKDNNEAQPNKNGKKAKSVRPYANIQVNQPIDQDEADEWYREGMQYLTDAPLSEELQQWKKTRETMKKDLLSKGSRLRRDPQIQINNAEDTSIKRFSTPGVKKNLRIFVTYQELQEDFCALYGHGVYGEKPEVALKHLQKPQKRPRSSSIEEEITEVKRPRHSAPIASKKGKSNTRKYGGNSKSPYRQTRKDRRRKDRSASQGEKGRQVNVKETFKRHATKKGWNVCRNCGTDVWPPNMQKHYYVCKKQNEEAQGNSKQ